MTANDIAIQASGLTVLHDQHILLAKITLDIPRGAVVGLVGRNGAGKSTLLRCLAGLTEPHEGSASLLGCPSLELTDAVRARLGYVSQSPDLFQWMDAIEHLRIVGQAYPRWSEERCRTLAARLDLPLGTKVSELSVGDQQKMAVVLALAHEPDVLLLDEPVSSLDSITRREFMRAMFGGDGADRTVVISSHILTDLERVVSHVAFIRDGRLQLFDTWDAILESLRLVPATARGVPADAIVCGQRGATHLVIDSRRAPDCPDAGRVLTLDELFVELNT